MKLEHGMILAAGFGKRMLPITKKVPKPLIKIGNSTLLENSIMMLKEMGIKKIVINTHHLSIEIERYINGKDFGLDIQIVQEKKIILDTGGGILNATFNFEEKPFIVLNPDTVWNKKHLSEFINLEKTYFDKKTASLLLVNKNKSFDKSFSGDFNLNNFGSVSRDNDNQMIYTGAQIISREVFGKKNVSQFSMNEIWDILIAKKSLYGVESKQEFLHVNNHEIYQKLTKQRFNY